MGFIRPQPCLRWVIYTLGSFEGKYLLLGVSRKKFEKYLPEASGNQTKLTRKYYSPISSHPLDCVTDIDSIIGLPRCQWNKPTKYSYINDKKCWKLPRRSPVLLQWRHNGRHSVSNHQPHDSLLNRLFKRRLKKISKLRVTGLCGGIHRGPVNSPHKCPVTRKMFLFVDVITLQLTERIENIMAKQRSRSST